jgi:hypothetical protein
MMKTFVIASLMTVALAGLCPPATAADCSLVDPGTPGGGAVGAAEWYVSQNAYLACQMNNSVQASAFQHGNDVAGKLGLVAGGALDLFNTAGLAPAVTAYGSTVGVVANSEGHDICGALIGDTNPQCANDLPVSQTQACPSGVAIPNPAGGGLAGNTLANSNSALQATCALAAVAVSSVPGQAQIMAYEGTTETTLFSLNGDIFAIGSETLDAVCIYLTGSTPCV